MDPLRGDGLSFDVCCQMFNTLQYRNDTVREFGRSDVLRYVEEAVFGDYLASLRLTHLLPERGRRVEGSVLISTVQKTVECGMQ